MTSDPSAGSGVQEVGEPERSAVDDRKLPKMTGAPGRVNWVSAQPAIVSASDCAIAPGCHRAHRAAENERHHDGALVGAGVGAQGLGHRHIIDEGRIGVDVAHDDAMLVDELASEDDPRHLDQIFSPLLRGHRAHERLVGEAQMRRDHVEMAFVDGDVDRLADRAAGMV